MFDHSFSNSPTTPPFPKKENVIRYPAWGIEVKLWPSRQGFLRNSLRSKLHPFVTLAHVQMIYFETQFDFTENFFDILKWLFSFSSQRRSVTLRFFKVSFKKEVYWWRHFCFSWRHQQSGFWPANYAPVTWTSQLLYRLSSFHIAGPDFDCGGEGIYVSSILTIASFRGFFACTQCLRKNKKDKIT